MQQSGGGIEPAAGTKTGARQLVRAFLQPRLSQPLLLAVKPVEKPFVKRPDPGDYGTVVF
jgi:hypothetical protein